MGCERFLEESRGDRTPVYNQGNVTTSYTTTCLVRKKHKKCTKSVTQRLTAKLAATSTYRITTPRMHKGKHVFTLYGLDIAGHRQAKPTKLTKTTR